MKPRDCIAYVLGVEAPRPEGGEPGFRRAWFGGRNLGLVPVADPASFAWPGRWIAADREGRHAVMFGSPSGPVAGDLGEIERGWVGVHRAGIRADLLTGGTIAVGDRVEPL